MSLERFGSCLVALLVAATLGCDFDGGDDGSEAEAVRSFSLQSARVELAFDESVTVDGAGTVVELEETSPLTLEDASDASLFSGELRVSDAVGNSREIRVDLEVVSGS